jgi:ribosomal protein S1
MKVKIKVIGLDSDKISLSIKRLKENPWDILAREHKVNDIISAPISRISQFGAFIELTGGIQGLIHLSEISHGVVKDIREHVKVGEEVKAKIINFDPKKKRIGLSLKALTKAPAKKAEKKDETKKDEVKAEKKAPAKKAEKKVEKKDEVKTEKKAPAKKATAKKTEETK